MFTIRQKQMEELSAVPRGAFASRAFRHLIQVYPEFVVPREEPEVMAWIQEAISRALSHQIEHEPEVLGFIDLSVEQGLAFEDRSENGQAKTILADPELTEIEKIQQLRNLFDGELADESAEQEDSVPGAAESNDEPSERPGDGD
jgi:hypothetical protein